MASYVGAIDQGTTSTRFIVFDQSGGIVATAQREHQQIYPQPGWVEHGAEEISRRTVEGNARSPAGRSCRHRHYQPAGNDQCLEPQNREPRSETPSSGRTLG